jgi:hypothetical protein
MSPWPAIRGRNWQQRVGSLTVEGNEMEGPGVVNPKVEMQRLAGKFAFLFAGVYLIILFSAVVSAATGNPIPLIGWPLLLIPAAAFVPSFIEGVRLHRTTDAAELSQLWWRSLGMAAIGLALAVAAVLIVGKIES